MFEIKRNNECTNPAIVCIRRCWSWIWRTCISIVATGGATTSLGITYWIRWIITTIRSGTWATKIFINFEYLKFKMELFIFTMLNSFIYMNSTSNSKDYSKYFQMSSESKLVFISIKYCFLIVLTWNCNAKLITKTMNIISFLKEHIFQPNLNKRIKFSSHFLKIWHI
jgi:hypothetical protein